MKLAKRIKTTILNFSKGLLSEIKTLLAFSAASTSGNKFLSFSVDRLQQNETPATGKYQSNGYETVSLSLCGIFNSYQNENNERQQ
jgi:hypothetical protein